MKDKKASQTWISGRINWYDRNSGKGSIISDDGIWYRIHEFSKIQAETHKTLKEKARVEFELATDSIQPIIRAVRESIVEKKALRKTERSIGRGERSK